ncbi:hypothetical protein [Streptomyces halstedii]
MSSGPTLLVPTASWASLVSALKTDLISP